LAQHALGAPRPGLGDAQHLDRHLALEVAVAGQVHRAHPPARDRLQNLVAGLREVGPLRGRAQALERVVVQEPHDGTSPKTARASARNSSSLPTRSRSVPSTAARSSRRAQNRWFVTWVTGRPNSAASRAYVSFAPASAPSRS